MDIALWSVIGLVAVALLFDYTNGFHDSANSVSTVLATGALRPRLAVLWAAAFNFVAFAFFGTEVADTIGQTVEQGFVSVAVIFAALAGAILWNYATWWLGMPTSSSQALIGGLVGAGLAKGGLEAIKASSVQKAALFMVLSPPATWRGGEKLSIPLWVVLSAHAAIALGTLSAAGGSSAPWASASPSCGRPGGSRPRRRRPPPCSARPPPGAPVSTTQTVAGAVTGVGVADRETTVDWSVFGQMALCWVVTIPSAALAAVAVYQVTRLENHLLAGVVLGLLGVVAVAVLTVGVRRTLRAADLEPEPPSRPERQPVAG